MTNILNDLSIKILGKPLDEEIKDRTAYRVVISNVKFSADEDGVGTLQRVSYNENGKIVNVSLLQTFNNLEDIEKFVQ